MKDPPVPFTRPLKFAHLITIDVMAALLLAGVLLSAVQASQRMPGVPIGLGIVLASAASAAIGLRRWRPLTALALALTAEAMSVFLGFVPDLMIVVAAALYVVALVKPVRTAMRALIAVGAALAVLCLITLGIAHGNRVDANR